MALCLQTMFTLYVVLRVVFTLIINCSCANLIERNLALIIGSEEVLFKCLIAHFKMS